MPPRQLPRLIDDHLFTLPGESQPSSEIEVDSVEWFEWLDAPMHSSFSYQTPLGIVTVRREQKRHGQYWYAYRAFDGKLHKVYLGKSSDLCLGHLREATASLTAEAKGSARISGVEISFFGSTTILRDGVLTNLTV